MQFHKFFLLLQIYTQKVNLKTDLFALSVVNVVCERPFSLLANKIPPSLEGLFRANSKKEAIFHNIFSQPKQHQMTIQKRKEGGGGRTSQDKLQWHNLKK